MPDPSELIFPDEPVSLQNDLDSPPPRPEPPRPRPPVRPPFPPLCSISGTVQSRFNFPISDARVALYPSAGRNVRPIDEVRTNRLGQYAFRQVRPGAYTLVVTNRFRIERKSVSVTPRRCRQTGINFRL